MPPAHSLAHLFRDLQQLERCSGRQEAGLRQQGAVILDALLEHTPYGNGAVYLRYSEDSALRLVAGTSSGPVDLDVQIPATLILATELDSSSSNLATSLSSRPQAIIPLRDGKHEFGFIALGGAPDDDRAWPQLLDAASGYIAALLGTQRMAAEKAEGDLQLRYRLLELESLYDIGLSIASTLDRDRLAEEILIRTISLLNARRAALFLRTGGRFALHRSFGQVRSQFLDDELEAGESSQLLEGKPVVFTEGANCIFPGCTTVVAMPIKTNLEVIGILAAGDRELREGGVGAFEDNDLRVLSLFANQAAIALENARLHQEALEKQTMEREIELAATIQRDILPRAIPDLPGFDIAAISKPARQLGGDYHAFLQRGDQLSICVADVAGKSTPAAILLSAFHAAIQLLFDEGRELSDIATELNKHIHRWSSRSKFVTLVLVTIDQAAGKVRYVNAGHNPAYIVTRDRVETLASHGLPIGILAEARYSTQTADFPPDALLTLYSDGITEAENVSDDEFGNDRLAAVLREHVGDNASAVGEAVLAAVDKFVGEAPQKDDQTLVVVKRISSS